MSVSEEGKLDNEKRTKLELGSIGQNMHPRISDTPI
jgi:hypothetical protein